MIASTTTWMASCTVGLDVDAPAPAAATAKRRIMTRPAKPRLSDLRRQAWTAGSVRATSQNRMIGSMTRADHTMIRTIAAAVATPSGMAFANVRYRAARNPPPAAATDTTATACQGGGMGINEAR